MIVKYTKLKSENLISFLEPEVFIAKKGHIVYENNCATFATFVVRHLIHTKEPGRTLGNLETIFIDGKRITQSFFPIGGTTAVSERKSNRIARSGKYFDIAIDCICN